MFLVDSGRFLLIKNLTNKVCIFILGNFEVICFVLYCDAYIVQ